MQPMGEDLEIDGRHRIYAVSFSSDGREILSGGAEGMVRRWRVDDGQEVGEAISTEGATVFAVALSRDRKWLVCGLNAPPYARVWNAETHARALDIKKYHTGTVSSVDVSLDSAKFATGGSDKHAFVWSLTGNTRKPLRRLPEHDGYVVAVRFSPNSDRIATADAKSIRIHDGDKGQQLLVISCQFDVSLSSPLDWSADGSQLFAASFGEAKVFDTSSASMLRKWPVPGSGSSSIVLSPNRNFIAVATDQSLSFWDVSTHQQIGSIIKHKSKVRSIAFSPNDDCIATGEENGKVILRSLSILQLPLVDISPEVFKLWRQSNLTNAQERLEEEIMQSSDLFHHARALAHRALIQSRLKQYDTALDDAKKSLEIQRSVIGHIALAVAHAGNNQYEPAMRAFDLVFSEGLLTENNLVLLIKAILLFESGNHDDAISRINDLIIIVNDKPLYTTVRAQMLVSLGGKLLSEGDYERAIGLLRRAWEAAPFQQSHHLIVISLVFGWDFDDLVPAIQRHLQECIRALEDMGDAAIQSQNPEEAVQSYSSVLSLYPPNRASLFVKRSKARAMLKLWDGALSDANEAINAEPRNPWGYERKYAALHALRRYDEAVDAVNCMHSFMADPPDLYTRELGVKYASPTKLTKAINDIVFDVSKTCPFVLIDVKSGRLCDTPERMNTFRSELQFKELVSCMALELDDKRILEVVEGYFQYVTFSHVWEGREPLHQDVKLVDSVWNLDPSPLNIKLQRFCEVVREDGYRWAWSDTCCIEKTISTMLNQSLRMMYKWYEASAATFVLLADVNSLSGLGSLKESRWMTRAWTSQELLSPKMIRFYDSNWKPYRGDTCVNHKESEEIMRELADATGIDRELIRTFNPEDLGVREKLRLASTRNATLEEDIAYSLIGIFKSDIQPEYGERDAALGHLLEETVTRSGEVTVLAWAGKSSSYHSCLPATLAVYRQIPEIPALEEDEMAKRVAALKKLLSQDEALSIHGQITRLPQARFSHRRLYLPCIMFFVKKLTIREGGNGQEQYYRARVPGLGRVEFQTSVTLSSTEPGRLVFVYPWIRHLHDSLDQSAWGCTSEWPDDDHESDDDSVDDSESDLQHSLPSLSLHGGATICNGGATIPAPAADDYTRALRLVARLQQPFHVLLLQQQPNREFKRVATEHEIEVQGILPKTNFTKDIRIEVVEIL